MHRCEIHDRNAEKKNTTTTVKRRRGVLLMLETSCPCRCASEPPDRHTDPQHVVGDQSPPGWVDHSLLPAPPLGPRLVQRL